MMPRDKNGVVDVELKVYGTKNVRVIDLSIVPLHVAAHTQGKPRLLPSLAAYRWLSSAATVYAIAEAGEHAMTLCRFSNCAADCHYRATGADILLGKL